MGERAVSQFGGVIGNPKVKLYVAGRGRKAHLFDVENEKVLCGLSGYEGYALWWEEWEIEKPWTHEEYIQDFDEELERWINWMDNAACDIELCEKCRKIALNRIRGKKNEGR